MDKLFSKLVGPNAEMRLFQRRAAEAILKGKNVIMRAPTGSGKTWAPILPFLYSLEQGKPIADRLFYTVPLRSLASGQLHSLRKVMRYQEDPQLLPNEEISVGIQTGSTPYDPHFLNRVIITTIDQLLSSYLFSAYSVGRSSGNINAGSLIGSLIVADEIHLYDKNKALLTLLESAGDNRLKGLAQFVLMTATLPTRVIEKLAKYLDAEVIQVEENELSSLPSHRDKKRIYRWVPSPLSGQAVLEKHKENSRSLVICNTVARAQEIYLELKAAMENSEEKVPLFLLHSRFFEYDRKRIEDELENYFNASAEQTNIIAVTTQVVEAGLDWSADQLHTELAPANALVQRAGRCARFPSPRNIGNVYIYELKEKGGSRDLGPYREQAEEIRLTQQELEKVNGNNLSFKEEETLIDSVHGEIDNQFFGDLDRLAVDQFFKIEKVLPDPSQDRTGFIREINSINLILAEEPNLIDFEQRPYLLSIPASARYTLKKILAESEKVIFSFEGKEDDEPRWVPVIKSEQLESAYLLCLTSKVADYTSAFGLRLGVEGNQQQPRYRGKKDFAKYSYQTESWIEHAKRALDAHARQEVLFAVAREKLACCIGIRTQDLRKLEELVIALHDTGKLDSTIQVAYKRWLQDHYPEEANVYEEIPLAHTNFNPDNDVNAQKESRYKRPPHAAEGAFAVKKILWSESQELLSSKQGEKIMPAMLKAIASHHGAREHKLRTFSLIPRAQDEVNKLITGTADLLDAGLNNHLNLTLSGRRWILFAYFVRCLRLADQGALTLVGKEVKDN